MLVLASASPRRREILANAGYTFEIRVTDADESVPDKTSAKNAVELISLAKAKAARRLCGEDDVILAADTVVELGGKILGKPRDAADAEKMLRSLSGNTHRVYTGVTVQSRSRSQTFSVCTEVTFYPLSDEEIFAYIATNEPFDKAGAYGIQGRGCLLVQSITGDYFNVMGLPVAEASRVLRGFMS